MCWRLGIRQLYRFSQTKHSNHIFFMSVWERFWFLGNLVAYTTKVEKSSNITYNSANVFLFFMKFNNFLISREIMIFFKNDSLVLCTLQTSYSGTTRKLWLTERVAWCEWMWRIIDFGCTETMVRWPCTLTTNSSFNQAWTCTSNRRHMRFYRMGAYRSLHFVCCVLLFIATFHFYTVVSVWYKYTKRMNVNQPFK